MLIWGMVYGIVVPTFFQLPSGYSTWLWRINMFNREIIKTIYFYGPFSKPRCSMVLEYVPTFVPYLG